MFMCQGLFHSECLVADSNRISNINNQNILLAKKKKKRKKKKKKKKREIESIPGNTNLLLETDLVRTFDFIAFGGAFANISMDFSNLIDDWETFTMGGTLAFALDEGDKGYGGSIQVNYYFFELFNGLYTSSSVGVMSFQDHTSVGLNISTGWRLTWDSGVTLSPGIGVLANLSDLHETQEASFCERG